MSTTVGSLTDTGNRLTKNLEFFLGDFDMQETAGDETFTGQVAQYIRNKQGYTFYVQVDSTTTLQLGIFASGIVITDSAGNSKGVATISTLDNYADDAAAAAGGIGVNRQYHTDGVVKVRLV